VAVLVAVLAAILGAATGWREWTGIAVALAVLLVSAVLMALGRSSCTVDLDLPQNRFVVGEPASATMAVRNTANRRMLPLRMELEIAGVPVTVPVPALPVGGSHVLALPLPTGRRAVVELGPIRAVRGDVFGLIRRVVLWPVHRQVFVHPRTVRPGSAMPGFVRDLEGEESTLRTASDLSFHTLREYVPGDDRRFIHWKSSARNGTLQVREFLQTHRSLVAVVMSGRAADYYPTSAGDHRRGGQEAGGDRPAEDPLTGDPSPPPPARVNGVEQAANDQDHRAPDDDEFEVAVSCAASVVAELVRERRDVATVVAGVPIRGATAEGVLDQFCAVDMGANAPDLVFETRQAVRRYPRVSLVVLVFGSPVGSAQVRVAVRSCPAGASVLALRARAESSPHPVRLTGSNGSTVLTVADVEALPAALREAS
jgi:hypothetical protein